MQFNFLLINSFAFALCSLELMFMFMQFAFCSLEHIIVYILLPCACFVFVCVNPMQMEKGLRFRTLPMLNRVSRATRPHAFRMLKYVEEQLGLMPLECLILKMT
jgi:hypothetical protein